ncbi:Protein of unknown function [Sphingomonas palmae]|uniref:DUF2490 domain-containing protein n=1 Tax=Sphingomonas palmae TaxID=1855283 RepID=A0A1H7HPR3_9SPHN|nr:DUF2490 domain-containing protein [Sphingomonas palmae]SEK52271.1 Protein of unknown function [Sphingomonas palmae]
MTPRAAPGGAALLAAFIASPAAARGVQAWSQLQLTGGLGDGWSLASDVSARTATDNRARQLLVRLRAGRDLSDEVTVWLGYVRAETFNDDRGNGLEQRATGQLDWRAGTIGPFELRLRTRAEARFFRNSGNVAGRLRQQVRLTLPVGQRIDLSAAAEPFVTINRNSDAPRTLDQLRLTATVSTKLTDQATLDVAYYNEHVFRPGRIYVNNIIPVTLAWRF